MSKKSVKVEVSPKQEESQSSDGRPEEPQEALAEAGVSNGPSAETAQAAEPESAPAEESDEDTQELTIEGLLADRERLTKEKEEQFERLQRAQAEFDNTRKRLIREKEEAQEYAAMGLIESLLPIIDDFERALETPGLDAKIKEGLELIYKRIFEVFTRAGLKPIETEDGEFNPHLHHAVDRAPAEDDEQDNKILEVYQKGYMFKDRLLRAALVKVAVKE